MSDVDCHDREADEPEGMLQNCHDETWKGSSMAGRAVGFVSVLDVLGVTACRG